MTPDPTQDYWSVSEVAAFLGIKAHSVAHYADTGLMPEPDLRVGAKRLRLWRPATIITWASKRPRKGWR